MYRENVDDNDWLIGNHFAWGSSQINTDLALAAQCEFEEDIYLEDENFFDLLRSPMYRNLRQTFMEDAETGDSRALLNVVWRAYNAGLVSPDRLVPDTNEVRSERRMRRNEAKASHKAHVDATKLAKELGYSEQGK